MAHTVEAAELLDVDVDQLAWPLTLVALNGWRRFEIADAAQAVPTQDPADGGGRDGQVARDLRAGQALPTQGYDGRLCLGRGRPVQAAGPRGAILQPGGAFGFKAGDPLADRLGTDPHPLSHRLRGEATPGQPHQPLSTGRRQTRILVDVHPVPPRGLKLRNLSFLGPDRMDNLWKDHS